MYHHIPCTDRAAYAAATDLIARFGEGALDEAEARASTSRKQGNIVHFCRWRQTWRTIVMLCDEEMAGTVH